MSWFLLLALICFILGPINIAGGLVYENWFSLLVGIFCSVIGTYNLYTILVNIV